MKLTQEQIQDIEKYLDYKELEQVDLRYEVQDHMIASIEHAIEEGMLYNEALEKECLKWNKELQDYSSFWLGIFWRGPKISINKCVQLIKKTYINTFLVTISVVPLIFLFKTFVNTINHEFVNSILGVVYILIFMSILYFHVKMKSTNKKTTYRFLFKINAIGIAFAYILYNPLFTDILTINKGKDLSWLAIIFNITNLVFSYSFLVWYKAHMKSQELKSV